MTPAEIFASIRNQVLTQLVGKRGAAEHVYHGLDEEELSRLLDALLGKLQTYISERDPRTFRGYVRRWVALRVGAGARHENLIPALVSVGDEVIRTAQSDVGDTDETRALMRTVAQANFLAARVVVEVLADEYSRRAAQLDELRGGEAG